MASDLKLIIPIFTLIAIVSERNEQVSIKPVTAYETETVEILFTRTDDTHSSFYKYSVSKDHVSFLSLGQEKDGRDNFFCLENTAYSDICQERFSFRYVNDTHVSFQIRNVTLLDAGLYVCQKSFSEVGVTKDPQYEYINLSVQVRTKEIISPTVPWTARPNSEKPAVRTKEINSTTVPRATSHHSVIHPSLLVLMVPVLTALLALRY